MKLMMASALLSNALDPRSCFLQTLIGLACYAQGLRDKGFKILNALGVEWLLACFTLESMEILGPHAERN